MVSNLTCSNADVEMGSLPMPNMGLQLFTGANVMASVSDEQSTLFTKEDNNSPSSQQATVSTTKARKTFPQVTVFRVIVRYLS